MLRRLFFVALAVIGLYIWLKRRFGAAQPARGSAPAGGGGARRAAPTAADRMVRDRICNTFLPQSKAILLTEGGEEHHFCSEKCRQTYLAGRPRPKAAADL